MTQTLQYHAPNREAVNTESGYRTQPWTVAGVLHTLKGGGWFSRIPGRHEFGEGVAQFAYDAQSVYEDFRDAEDES